MKSVYLHKINQFVSSSDLSDSELKKQLKLEFNIVSRRTSRLTLLALLGALPLKPTQQCGVYLSSTFSSPSNMYDLQMHVFQHKTPRPFHFINSINNAVSFYIAQTLNITGPNLFIATDSTNWSQLFLPAIVDLQQGVIDQALVGWCYEHRQHVDKSKQEGSHWLLLSTQQDNALAKIQVIDNEQHIVENHAKNYGYCYQSMIELFKNLPLTEEDIFTNNIINNKALRIHAINQSA